MTEPFYEDESVVLYCADFRDILGDVVARHGVPDLVCVDPPYGETSLPWDRWPDGWPQLIPGRSMWCFGSMRMFLDRRDDFTSWKLSQDVVWEKHTGSGAAIDRFVRIHEHALHWYRGPWTEVYHQTPKIQRTGPRVATAVRNASGGPVQQGAYTPSTWVDDGTRWMPSVIRARTMHRQGATNETPKPPGLVEHLLTYGCPSDGLVLDVFAGGCSTLVAARNSGRRAIGIELREGQCAKAVEHRLRQTVLPLGQVP